MTEASFLRDLVVTLVAALVVLLPSRRLRIPPAVGFMLTGILIGPGALRLIGDARHVEALAEVGVSVLLFLVGLEFSIARLREIGRALLVAGPLQVGGTILLCAAGLLLLPLGASVQSALFAGMLLALSSTAMLLQQLRERGEFRAPHGRLLVGISLFQDFALIPMLVLIPALGAGGGVSAVPRLLAGILVAAALLLAARFLMPHVIGAVFRSGVRELSVMAAVAVCLGAALTTKPV